jgi:hypothetical protein
VATNRVFCPHCQAPLGAPAAGPKRLARCPRCAAVFALGGGTASLPDDEHITAHPAAPVVLAESPAAELPMPTNVAAPAVHAGRLVVAVAAVLLVVLVGICLAVYFSAENAPAADSVAEVPAPVEPPPPPQPLPAEPPATHPTTTPTQPPQPPQPLQPSLFALPPAEQAKVNRATDLGVQYLNAEQLPSGTWQERGWRVGYAALPGLTLLECGMPVQDPVIQKAAEFVRAAVPRLSRTYELSTAILFLQRLGDPKDQPLIRSMALRLVAGQTSAGGWSYQCPILSPNDEDVLCSLLGGLSYQTYLDPECKQPDKRKPLPIDALSDTLSKLAVLQDPKDIQASVSAQAMDDNSNTQFAVLALWSVRRLHLPTERTLALLYRRFRSTQDEDGRWCYRNDQFVCPWPTMTCSGLLGLAVGHGLIATSGKDGVIKDPAIDKGLAVIAKSLDGSLLQENNARCAPLYYLWSLERVGVLFRLRTLGGTNWYTWGEKMLLDNQQANGSWQVGGYPGSSPTIDTCFALLFLKRINLVQDLTDKLRMAVIDQ